MRDYVELVEELRDETCCWCQECAGEEECGFALKAKAADAIEELLAAVPHWISVEERLPRPFVSVLVNIPGENPFPTVKEAFLEKTGMWYSIGFRYEQKEVTHWCEMPEPPKEVE